MDRMDSIIAVAVRSLGRARRRCAGAARALVRHDVAKIELERRALPRNGAAPPQPGAARKSLTILGATGSIGKSTLDLVERNPDAFEVVALTAQSKVGELAKAARQTRARLAVIGEVERYGELKALLAGSGVMVAAGHAAIVAAAAEPADCVMAAIVGAAGLGADVRGGAPGAAAGARQQGMPRLRGRSVHGRAGTFGCRADTRRQ
jgi:FlaA1/EpsC-like NDP-sugar epimerase